MQTPPMSEFIELARRRGSRGGRPLANTVNFAVYNTKSGFQTITVRISEDIAAKLGLVEGMKLSCFVHPDQTHIALKQANGRGATLYKPQGARSFVYQTNVKGGTLEPQRASSGTISRVDEALVISITPS